MTKKKDSHPWLQQDNEILGDLIHRKSTVGLKQKFGVRGADDKGCHHTVPGATSWRMIP